MFTYFKMKKNEWKIRNAIYNGILGFMESKRDIVDTAKKLFDSVKDMSAKDIRDEFIGKLAEIVHEESKKQRNNKETETTLDE
ncbi:MAG: hypothetical protein HDT48_07125 [Ruminococcaceae bacterium]|nr:hypothetical protein [Oscillospiraceae bacterium]